MAAPGKYQQAQIVWRKDHAPDLWSIRLHTDPKPSFESGQYVTLGVEENGRVIERAYSIVSSPAEDELELFFELVPQGELTPRLHRLQTGDKLLVRPRPKGVFTLDAKSGKKNHLLISTVTGVAPFVSMTRTLARQAEVGQPPDVKVLLLEAASRAFEFGYREELEQRAAAHPRWLRFVASVSRPWEEPGWSGERGRVEDILRKYLDESGMSAADTVAYLCGHPGMVENAKGILLRAGFERDDLHVEVYWMPKKEPAPRP